MTNSEISVNRNYNRGRSWEYEIMEKRRASGCVVMRTSGSHGFFDVIAINLSGGVEFIQCKLTASETTARRLVQQFRDKPPFRPLESKFHQTMAVKIKGGTYLSVTV